LIQQIQQEQVQKCVAHTVSTT